jgi:hypothetical protein
MPFTYEDSLQGERRNALTVPSARSEVLREQFAISFEENPIMAYRRFSELSEDKVTGPRLSAETARARLKDAGMENDLTITPGGISEAALLTLMDRKRIEKRRQEIFSRSEGGFTEGAARFGVAVATTLSDPISAGLNFVPVVGQAKYARWLSAARSLGGRVAVRAAVGAAEGAAGAAIAEVPIYAMRTQEQADYDMVDSLLNVAFGGVIGAGLHSTVGTAAEVLSRRLPSRPVPAARVDPLIGEIPTRAVESLPDDVQRVIFQPGAEGAVARMSPMARERALREAVAQAVEGQQADVETIVRTAAAEAQPAVVGFTTARGSTYDIGQSGVTTRNKAARSDPGHEGDAGPQPTSEATFYVRAEDAEKLGEFQTRGGARKAIAQTSDGRIGVKYLDGKDAGRFEGRTVVTPAAGPAVGMTPVETWRGGERVHFGNTITEVRTAPRPASAASPRTVDAEFRAATEHAENVLAREIAPTTEGALKAAEEEAQLAMADVADLAKRLDVDVKSDPDMVAALEGAEKAERWARVAELATVCLVRGG